MPDTQKEDELFKLSNFEPVGIVKTPSVEKIEGDPDFHETVEYLCGDDDKESSKRRAKTDTFMLPTGKLQLNRNGSGNPREKKKRRSIVNVMDEQENSTNNVDIPAIAAPIPPVPEGY